MERYLSRIQLKITKKDSLIDISKHLLIDILQINRKKVSKMTYKNKDFA